jgi:hypothetical protein
MHEHNIKPNSTQIHKIVCCKTFDIVSKLEYLWTTVTINLCPDAGTMFFENIGNLLHLSETSDPK